METETQHNTGGKKTMGDILQTILSRLEKKEAKISILATMIGILVTIIFSVYEFPDKGGNKTFQKNQINGENQSAIQELPPVKSFIEYLRFISNKSTKEMWNHSTISRRDKLKNTDDMMYDYYLTSEYNVIYIIPILEGSKASATSPINTPTFSFYALLEFEDKVLLEDEVDQLQEFDIKTKIKHLCDSASLDSIFEPVLKEVYQFVDHRFVIDSAKYVNDKLRDYMMNMTLKEYITQDWRFPILFAKELRLPFKDYNPGTIYDSRMQKHTMLSRVVMIEDSIWKVDVFETVALSRWEKRNN